MPPRRVCTRRTSLTARRTSTSLCQPPVTAQRATSALCSGMAVCAPSCRCVPLSLACDRLFCSRPPILLTILLPWWQFSMNGARFKLLIPKENCVIIFSLAGIRCPQTSRNGSEAEPFADEAYAFSRSQCFQREVDVETEAVDKNGTFFGRCDSSRPDIHPTPTCR